MLYAKEKQKQYRVKVNQEILHKIDKYIFYFENLKCDEYLIDAENSNCSYSKEFVEFIDFLKSNNLTVCDDVLKVYIENQDNTTIGKPKGNCWVNVMNKTIARPDYLKQTDIDFIRCAFTTLIKFEEVFSGSWGIDIEVGAWLKLLRRLKLINTP